jgi:hypothetical protein
MTIPTCAQCKRVIPGEDINVANDVAYCRTCNLSYPLSDLTHDMEINPEAVDLAHPPAGVKYRDIGTGQVIEASHRSLGGALGTLAISLFWNGIVSIFVLVAIAGTLRNLHVTVPEWFPAPVMNGSPMSVGVTLFLWLFLTPFILIGMAMIGAFLSCLMGRTEVSVSRGECVVFTGLGPLGWRRRCQVSSIEEVRIKETQSHTRNGNSMKTEIVLDTREGKAIKFGSGLEEKRRKFVAAALRGIVFRQAPPIRR